MTYTWLLDSIAEIRDSDMLPGAARQSGPLRSPPTPRHRRQVALSGCCRALGRRVRWPRLALIGLLLAAKKRPRKDLGGKVSTMVAWRRWAMVALQGVQQLANRNQRQPSSPRGPD